MNGISIDTSIVKNQIAALKNYRESIINIINNTNSICDTSHWNDSQKDKFSSSMYDISILLNSNLINLREYTEQLDSLLKVLED